MKPNEAIKAISNLNTLKDLYFENSEPYNSIILAIQALESVSKADNGEVKNVEDIFKKSTKKNMVFYDHKNFGLAYPSLLKAIYEAMHEYHNQFLSVNVVNELKAVAS